MTPTAPADPCATAWRRRIGYAWILAALVTDQATKRIAVATLAAEPERMRYVLPVLDWRLVHNRGVSYGTFDSSSAAVQIAIIVGTAAIIAFLVYTMRGHKNAATLAGYGLIVGGALGNLADRLAFGFVVDFISFHVGENYWYVFNVGDVWIVGGVALVLVDFIRRREYAH